MRYLHPVQMHEKFVASGVYTIQPAMLPARTEQWSIHELPDSSWFIRADCELSSQGQHGLLLEGLVQTPLAVPKIERVDLRYVSGDKTNQTIRTQTLVFFEDYVQIGYTLDDHTREQIELPMAHGYIPAPEVAHILTGFYTRALLAQNSQPITVFRRYVTPRIDLNIAQLTVRPLEAEQITVAGKPIASQAYALSFIAGSDPKNTQHTDKPHAVDLKIWLIQNNVLAREDGEHHGVNLSQYAQRPEPKK